MRAISDMRKQSQDRIASAIRCRFGRVLNVKPGVRQRLSPPARRGETQCRGHIDRCGTVDLTRWTQPHAEPGQGSRGQPPGPKSHPGARPTAEPAAVAGSLCGISRNVGAVRRQAPGEFGGQLVLSNAPALDLGLGPRPYYRQPSVLARRPTVQRTQGPISASIGQLHMAPEFQTRRPVAHSPVLSAASTSLVRRLTTAPEPACFPRC